MNDHDDVGGNKLDEVLFDDEMKARFFKPLHDSISYWIRKGLSFEEIVENVDRSTEWKYPLDLIQLSVREYTIGIAMDI